MSIDLKKILGIHNEINAQTDRGAAIIAAAILDDALEDALRTRLILTASLSDRIFSSENGPLARFSAKIDIAAATGLLPKEMCDGIHLVRRIRNKFAHSIEPLKFADQEISAWAKSLHVGIDKIDKVDDIRLRFTLFSVGTVIALLLFAKVPALKIVPVKELPSNTEITGQFAWAAIEYVGIVVSQSQKPA
jgi:DNA-binding MltR family transcriptional regulator